MTTWSLFAATGFTSAQSVHADHHGILYAPGSSSRAIWGSDGGVHYTATANSTLPAKPTFMSKNTGYNVTQYYGTAIHPTLPDYFLAGAQDNGSQKFTAAGINATSTVSGGDGGFCHIDQDDPNIQITSFVFNNYYVSINGGASFVTRSFANTGGFINPTDYDDSENILYGGNTAGSYFRWNNPAEAGTSVSNVTCSQFGTASVTHVAVSPFVPNRVFFGLSNGSIVMVDGANTASSVTGVVIKPVTAPSSGSVSAIAFDLTNDQHLLVTYSNYGVVSVAETTTAGAGVAAVWTSVEGNLPDMPVRWVLFDPRNPDWALIATEIGVWSTDNINGAATDWQPTNGGLANVRVDMLQFRPSDRTIAAATHGRGLYTTVIPGAPPVTTPNLDFTSPATDVVEQTGATSDCRNYKDYEINITTSAPLVGDAVLTYSVEPGGTATAGNDYDLTTNGDFATPTTTHTFKSGSLLPKKITVRIYDDTEVEVPETFVIRFRLSGNSNAVTRRDTHTFTIRDNDVAPGAGTIVATALNASRTEYLGVNTDAYFYTASGELLARMRNTSTHNYGCTGVTIDRSGTSALPFLNAAPATYLASKTYTVVPASGNPAGKYEVTLYFTEAEKRGWELTTGNAWNAVMIVKTTGTIKGVNALSPPTVQLITPVREKIASGYALTFVSDGAAAGFGVGVPGTPNSAPVVFPNPFRDRLSIRFVQPIKGPALVSVYDIEGKLIHRSTHPGSVSTALSIDLRNFGLLSNTIYIVDLQANGKKYRFKVKKE